MYIILQLCQRICLLSVFYAECSCLHPSYLDDDDSRKDDIKPCDLAGAMAVDNSTSGEESDRDCVYRIYDLLDNKEIACDCR